MTTTASAAVAAPPVHAPFGAAILAGDLRDALRVLAPAIGKGAHALPPCAAVRVLPSPVGLRLVAYDLEVAVSVDVAGAGDVYGPGAAIPAALLAAVAKGAKDRTLRVTVDAAGGVTVDDGACVTRGAAVPAEDLPEIPDTGAAPVATLPAVGFAAAMKAVLPAAAQERMRYALREIEVSWRPGARFADVVATDGRRLHVASPAADVLPPDRGRVLLAEKAARAAVLAWGGRRGAAMDVTFSASLLDVEAGTGARRSGVVALAAGSVTIVARIPEGAFPNWLDVIPRRDALAGSIRLADPAAAVRALRGAASAIGSCTLGHARFRLDGDGVAVRVFRDGAEIQAFRLAAEAWDGEALEFGANPGFVADALDAGTDTLWPMLPTVRHGKREFSSPFMVTASPTAAGSAANVRGVVMPVSLD